VEEIPKSPFRMTSTMLKSNICGLRQKKNGVDMVGLGKAITLRACHNNQCGSRVYVSLIKIHSRSALGLSSCWLLPYS